VVQSGDFGVFEALDRSTTRVSSLIHTYVLRVKKINVL
jgi:hypothetical protein